MRAAESNRVADDCADWWSQYAVDNNIPTNDVSADCAAWWREFAAENNIPHPDNEDKSTSKIDTRTPFQRLLDGDSIYDLPNEPPTVANHSSLPFPLTVDDEVHPDHPFFAAADNGPPAAAEMKKLVIRGQRSEKGLDNQKVRGKEHQPERRHQLAEHIKRRPAKSG